MAQLDLKVLIKTAGERELDRAASKMQKVQKGLAIGGAAVGAALVGGLVEAGQALIEIERLNAQTSAAIRSTGGAANVTLDDVEKLAEGLEQTTTVEREVTQEAANMLLTFTNVRNELGKGNDIFDQTTAAALDMSVAMGTDATSAAMMLGKAMNDPTEGLAKLTRAGVQFTDEQKAMVAELQETGDLLGAQKIILAELETQFGGSAEAFANTTAGRIQRFQNDVGNMFESIIVGATKVADFLTEGPLETGWTWYPLGPPEEVREATREAALVAQEETWTAAQGVISASVQGYADGMPELEEQARLNGAVVPDAITARWQDTRDAAFETAVQHALGVLDGQNDIEVAFEAMTRLQEEEQTEAQRISYLMGKLNSTELARGLDDERDGVSDAAKATRGAIIAELASLGVDAYNSGLSVSANVASGINNNAHLVDGATSALAAKISGYLPRSEPKWGPLKGITTVGDAIVEGATDGIFRNLGTADRAGSLLAASLSPGLIGGSLSGARGSAGGASGGGDVIINLTVQGSLVADEKSLPSTLSRAAFVAGLSEQYSKS